MFTRKLLSLVGLLFVGSQISRVKAEDCTITYDSTEGSCTAQNCNEGYYAVFEDGSINSNSGADGDLVEVGSGNICTKSNEIGYFKSPDNKYISNSHEGKANIISITEGGCVADNVGLLVNDGDNDVLCLDYYASEKKPITVAFGDSKDKYLLKYDGTNGALFTSDNNTARVVIAPSNNALKLYVYNLNDNHGIYCDYEENKVMTRFENFCEGTILNFLYDCSSGLCTQEDSAFSESNDYLVKVGDADYKIYKSKSESGTTSFTAQTTSEIAAFKKVAEDITYYDSVSNFDKYLNGITEGPSNEYHLFDCHNGNCKITEGYAKFNSGSSVGLAKFDSSTESWNLVSGLTCNSSSDIGNVQLDDQGAIELCIGGSGSFSSTTDGNIYLMSKENAYISSIVKGNIVGASTPENGYYLIDNNNVLSISSSSSSTADKLINCGESCVEGINAVGYYLSGIDNGLIKCDTADDAGSCSIHTVTNGYYPNAVDGKALYICGSDSESEPVTCTEKDTAAIGYYQNGEASYSDGKYIKCTSTTSCETMSDFASECSSETDIGKITNDGALCLDNDGPKTAAFFSGDSTTESRYLIKIGTESIYSSVVNFGVIDTSNNALIIDTTVTGDRSVCFNLSNNILTKFEPEDECNSKEGAYDCESGLCTPGCNPSSPEYCVINKFYATSGSDALSVLIKPSSNKDYNLVYCTSNDKACEEISAIGYYVNSKDEAFYCSKGKCKLATVSSVDDKVNGGLYTDNTDVFLCLDKEKDIYIKIDGGNKGNYLVKFDADNIFEIGENKQAIFSVDTQVAIFNNSYNNKMKYVYVNGSKLKVLIRGEECPSKNGNLDVLEVQCENGLCCPISGCST